MGPDGILHLDIPVGLSDRDINVMVVYQPVQAAMLPLKDPYGVCVDDPIRVDDEGISDALDTNLAEAFE